MKVWQVLGVSLLLVGGAVAAHAMTSGSAHPAPLVAAVTTSSSPADVPLALADPSTTAGSSHPSATVPAVGATTPSRSPVTTVPPAATNAPAPTLSTSTTRPTTTTAPRNYGSELPPGSTAPPPHDTCTMTASSTVRQGATQSASVHVTSLNYRAVPVALSVSGRAVANGVTNNQGYYLGSFTAQQGDSEVIATISRQGVATGTCSARYTVT